MNRTDSKVYKYISEDFSLIRYIDMKLSFTELLDLFATGKSDKIDYAYTDCLIVDLKDLIVSKLIDNNSVDSDYDKLKQMYIDIGIDLPESDIRYNMIYNLDLFNYIKNSKFTRLLYLIDPNKDINDLYDLSEINLKYDITEAQVFSYLYDICKENNFDFCQPIEFKYSYKTIIPVSTSSAPQKFIRNRRNFVLILKISRMGYYLYASLIFIETRCIIILPEFLDKLEENIIFDMIGLPLDLYNIDVYNFYKNYAGTNINNYYDDSININLLGQSWIIKTTIDYVKENVFISFPLTWFQKQIKKYIIYDIIDDINITQWHDKNHYESIVNYDENIKYTPTPHIKGEYFIYSYTNQVYVPPPPRTITEIIRNIVIYHINYILPNNVSKSDFTWFDMIEKLCELYITYEPDKHEFLYTEIKRQKADVFFTTALPSELNNLYFSEDMKEFILKSLRKGYVSSKNINKQILLKYQTTDITKDLTYLFVLLGIKIFCDIPTYKYSSYIDQLYYMKHVIQQKVFNKFHYTHSRNIEFFNNPTDMNSRTYDQKLEYIFGKECRPYKFNSNIKLDTCSYPLIDQVVKPTLPIADYYNKNPNELIEDIYTGTTKFDRIIFTDHMLKVIDALISSHDISWETVDKSLSNFMIKRNIPTPGKYGKNNIFECLIILSKINPSYYRIIFTLANDIDFVKYHKSLTDNIFVNNSLLAKIFKSDPNMFSYKGLMMYEHEYFNKITDKCKYCDVERQPHASISPTYINYLLSLHKNSCFSLVSISISDVYGNVEKIKKTDITPCIINPNIHYIIIDCGVYDDGGHANIILVNKITKDILWFEPHGVSSYENVFRNSASEIFRAIGIPVEIYGWNILWMSDLISTLDGPQSLEPEKLNNPEYSAFGGYCLIWCMFVIEYYITNWVIRFPTAPIKNFIDDIMEYILKNSRFDFGGILAVNPTFFIHNFLIKMETNLENIIADKSIVNLPTKIIGNYFIYNMYELSSTIENSLLNIVNLISKSIFKVQSRETKQLISYQTEIKLFENGKEVHSKDTYEDKLKIILTNKDKFLNFKTL